MIIYKLTNKINGKIYIGQTIKSFEERLRGHIYDSKYRKSLVIQDCQMQYENMVLIILIKK